MIVNNPINKRIYFFYPSKVLGGIEMLFFRMANSLHESGFDVRIIDFKGGIYSEMSNLLCPVIECTHPVKIEQDAVVVTPPVDLDRIPKLLILSRNTYFLFWFLNPFNLIQILPLMPVIPQHSSKFLLKAINKHIFRDCYNMTKKFLKVADVKSGLCFMDSNVMQFNSFFFDYEFLNENFVRIPVDLPQEEVETRYIVDVLRCAWIGRLKKDTVPILRYLLEDLNELATIRDMRIEMNIIGEGSEVERIREICSRQKNLEIIFKGTLPGAELRHFLKESVDCTFAFGTSALEGAKLGLPACLLDPSYKRIPKKSYRYKWLFQSSNYQTGRLMDHHKKLPEENTMLISDVVDSLLFDYERVSTLSFEYVKKNHSVLDSYQDFKNSVTRTTLEFRDIEQFLKAPFIISLSRLIKRHLHA